MDGDGTEHETQRETKETHVSEHMEGAQAQVWKGGGFAQS